MRQAVPEELDILLARGLFEQAPFNVAVIDREFRVVTANRNFLEYFGEWQGRRCYEVYKNRSEPCPHCQARATFQDGQARVSDETGLDRRGRSCHYVLHVAPLRDAAGRIEHVVEMTTDLTETRRWQREYDLLFERAPCYITVIDRDYRIVRANERFRRSFGEAGDRLCYQVYKRRKQPCGRCPAALTFRDGAEHVSHQVGVHRDGSPAYYVVTTVPLSRGEGEVAHVIEMAADVTPIRRLEIELKRAQSYYECLIENAATAIVAVDARGQVTVMNPAARTLLGWKARQPPGAERLKQMLPAEFFETSAPAPSGFREATVRDAQGRPVPVRWAAAELRGRRGERGRAAFLEDLREVKRLEREMLEAERLAAVGQTVAGLAHTIKNLLMGLEGGMYMMDTGLRRADAARISEGWQVLQRNVQKTTALVKDFLSFAKGRQPQLRPADPNALARNVVELYREAARLQGVELRLDAGGEVREAPLDPQGIETCLTNLISNGIDAAVLREQGGGEVTVRTREADEELIFEVSDNGCGMDQEVKEKVFTTFFTTKGGKGTGLGLLTTRKIVQEHGGRIEVDSAPELGSTFRIRLPRRRLQALAAAETGGVRPEEAP